jgi:hypothetical protein
LEGLLVLNQEQAAEEEEVAKVERPYAWLEKREDELV